MKNIKIILLLVGLFSTTAAIAQRTNFSGTWKINLEKSEFGGVPAYTMNKAAKVTQTTDQITLETTNVDDAGKDSVSVHTFYLNGTPQVFSSGGMNKKAKLTFSADGHSLNENIIYLNSENGKAVLVKDIVWSLAADKKTLTMLLKAEQSNGKTYSVRAIYDKQ